MSHPSEITDAEANERLELLAQLQSALEAAHKLASLANLDRTTIFLSDLLNGDMSSSELAGAWYYAESGQRWE